VKGFAHSEKIIRFGFFELKLQSRELRKHGICIKLHGQPYQILAMLLEHPGEVVTREEIRQRLWPSDTFVEFDGSVHSAVKNLRKALGDSADHPHYIETVPRAGYRFILPVKESSSDESSASEGLAVTGEVDFERHRIDAAERQRFRRWWLAPVAIGLGLAAALGVYSQRSRHRLQAQQSTPRIMLAVLPFENLTGDAGQDYFSDGLTEEMIAQLGRVDPHSLGVIARTSVLRYETTGQPFSGIGRELGVQYAVKGSVQRHGDKVQISAQLIQVTDQTQLWVRQFDRDLKDLLTLQAEITQEIADEVELTLGSGYARGLAPRVAPNPSSYEIYNLYLQGRYFWNKRTEAGFRRAADYFQQAIAKDPNYARAYAGLADTYALMSTWYLVPSREYMPKARAAVLRALQIDSSLAEAHTTLALISEQYDYDWQTAEKEFRLAIEFDPSYATAHQWYAECLAFEGRFEEALSESERARQLDPLSLVIANDHAAILLFSRQYDRAIEQFRAVREMEPGFPRSSLIISAYLEAGKFPEALAVIQELARRNQLEKEVGKFSIEAYVYGRSGRAQDAQRSFARFEERAGQLSPLRRLMPWEYLQAYLGVGRKDDAIAVLQKAYEDHSNILADLKVSPFYDPLRSDPRFQELLRRTGLAQ
jgi:TolB-like protein/DNA-binding winged helix-turn-helix (wHTH) protein/Tfp pilus assembly protein PilF